MKYTVRFAHLKHLPIWKTGDRILRGTIIGEMGSTGQSTGPHLHIDCVEGEQISLWRLHEAEDRTVEAAHRQIQYFIDAELFGVEPRITTSYNDLGYFWSRKKVHLGYDLVPSRRGHDTIHWNRSMPGKVTYVGHDPGYGNTIMITFEAGAA
jgi:murein DD-endopeptidase MepM/ murein hydrolase activator NlpD